MIILCYMTVTKRFWMTFKPTQQQTKTKKPFIFLYNLFANHAHLAYYKSSLNWNRRIKCAAKWLTSTLRAFIIRFDEWMSRNITWFAGYFIESRWSSYKKRARDQLLICQKHCSCGWFIIRWDLYFLESLSWNCFLLCVRFYTSS